MIDDVAGNRARRPAIADPQGAAGDGGAAALAAVAGQDERRRHRSWSSAPAPAISPAWASVTPAPVATRAAAGAERRAAVHREARRRPLSAAAIEARGHPPRRRG